MAKMRSTATRLLCATLDDEFALRGKARELGVTQRASRIDAYALLATTILGVAMRGAFSIAQLGHTLSEALGHRFARSSVWSRFTPAFRDLVQHVLDEQVRRAREREVVLPGVLSSFRDVIAVDSTVVKVHDSLQHRWKGTRRHTATAALKVHAWVRAFTGELLKYRVTADAYGDARAFGVDHDLAGVLVLFDKAYSSPSLWRRVQSVNGYFLTRLPKDRDPEVVAELRKHRGRARKAKGRKLREVLGGLRRKVLDVRASFRCRVRKYRSTTNRWLEEEFRVVAVRQENGSYEVFVTNAPPSMLPAEAIPRTYRLRWEVETFFKTAKSGSGLRELPSTKAHIVETLVYASLLRATASMQALGTFRREVADAMGVVINPGQWQRWWNQHARLALAHIVAADNPLGLQALALLLADPNRGRPPNRETFRMCGYAW